MSEPPRRKRSVPFRPRFTLMLFYLFGFFLLFAMLFALPDLLAGARALPPGGRELTDEELGQAREIARNALGGGRLLVAAALSVLATGLGTWRGALPGLKES